MRIVYWDCRNGVSGTGLAGCLLALSGDRDEAVERLNEMGLPGVKFARDGESLSLSFDETVPGDISHPLLRDAARKLGEEKSFSAAEYALAAASFFLAKELGADRMLSSAVNLGACTEAAQWLAGKPVFANDGGHTDRLGAAILTAIVDDFCDMPVITLETSASCSNMRALMGGAGQTGGRIVELSASIDDMTPEALGFAMERFFAAGAVEAYTSPLNMKKSRPGVLLTVMCPEARKQEMLGEIFRHTTTIGVRANYSERFALERAMETVRTPLGEVRKKVSRGYGVVREKWEYEDLARIARETGMSIVEVCNQVSRGFDCTRED